MSTPTSPPPYNPPHVPVTLAELTSGLVWPRLLRAFPLSIRPARVFIGTAAVLIIWGLGALIGWATTSGTTGTASKHVPRAILMDIADGITGVLSGIVHLDTRAALSGLDLAITSTSVHSDRWVVVLLTAVVLVPVFLVGCCAVSRHAAVEIAHGADLPVRRALVFAVRRAGTLATAVLIPIVLAAVISLILKVAGWVLLSIPGVSLLGALLYPLAVAVGLAYVLLWVGWIAGQPLIAPAVSAENADAVDALQRAYSYVLGRPGRLLLYAAVLVIQGAVALLVVTWLLDSAHAFASANTSAWLTPERAGAVTSRATDAAPTARVLGFWSWMVAVVVAGWGLSFYATASTILYLLIRRVSDEQDVSEIWMPGKDASVRP